MARQAAKTFMINALISLSRSGMVEAFSIETNRDCRHRQGICFLAGTICFVGVSKLRGFDRH